MEERSMKQWNDLEDFNILEYIVTNTIPSRISFQRNTCFFYQLSLLDMVPLQAPVQKGRPLELDRWHGPRIETIKVSFVSANILAAFRCLDPVAPGVRTRLQGK